MGFAADLVFSVRRFGADLVSSGADLVLLARDGASSELL